MHRNTLALGRKEYVGITMQDPPRELVIKHPTFTYFLLSLRSSTSATSPATDILTARSYLTSALQQYLGMTGTAIPIDILKVEGRDVWIRAPKNDGNAIFGALSQWMSKDGSVSWRVVGRGDWLGALSAGEGSKLFEPQWSQQ